MLQRDAPGEYQTDRLLCDCFYKTTFILFQSKTTLQISFVTRKPDYKDLEDIQLFLLNVAFILSSEVESIYIS